MLTQIYLISAHRDGGSPQWAGTRVVLFIVKLFASCLGGEMMNYVPVHIKYRSFKGTTCTEVLCNYFLQNRNKLDNQVFGSRIYTIFKSA